MLHVVVRSHHLSSPSLVVKRDTSGVAGFFEDLPVLMFVLAGTFMIVASAVCASESVMSGEKSEELEYLVNRSADLVASEVLGEHSGIAVTVGSVCSTRLSQIVKDFLETRNFCMSIVIVHPEFKLLCQVPGPSDGLPKHACSASRLINALTDEGYVAILVVRLLAW